MVKPYLQNKKDKTFLDHWLLGDDLTALPGAVGVRPAEHGRAVLLSQRIAGEPTKRPGI